MIPAMGVEKELATAAAAPQPTSVWADTEDNPRNLARRLELVEPRWIAGPSLPPDCPVDKAIMPPKN